MQRVSDMISEITAAGQEQSAGVTQINDAITNMDLLTQQNAALVEEAAAAAAGLQEQAEKLSSVVSVFKLAPSSLGQPGLAAARSAVTATHKAATAARPVRPVQPGSSATSATLTRRQLPQKKAAPATAEAGDWEEF